MGGFGKFSSGLALTFAATAAGAQPSAAEVQAAVCQLTDCPAPADAAAERDDGSRVVGPQRSFSLARGPAAHAAAAPGPASTRAAAATPRARAAATPHRAPGKADMRVAFANGSADLTDEAMEHARIYAEALKSAQLAGAQFEIAGHTSSTGSGDANKLLSQRRAQAVVDYLVSQGISPDRLKAAGFGAERPLAGRRSTDAANRRVEIVKVG